MSTTGPCELPVVYMLIGLKFFTKKEYSSPWMAPDYRQGVRKLLPASLALAWQMARLLRAEFWLSTGAIIVVEYWHQNTMKTKRSRLERALYYRAWGTIFRQSKLTR